MKRINEQEWTDGVDTYVGSPKTGFTKKAQKVVEPQEPIECKPVDKLDEKSVDNTEE